ncbi:hypothetical protein BS78_04G025700 [Paspalum vaginatum]|nr:hypothetical protein BS78_04G025700 [Paspalum vaginatum]
MTRWLLAEVERVSDVWIGEGVIQAAGQGWLVPGAKPSCLAIATRLQRCHCGTGTTAKLAPQCRAVASFGPDRTGLARVSSAGARLRGVPLSVSLPFLGIAWKWKHQPRVLPSLPFPSPPLPSVRLRMRSTPPPTVQHGNAMQGSPATDEVSASMHMHARRERCCFLFLPTPSSRLVRFSSHRKFKEPTDGRVCRVGGGDTIVLSCTPTSVCLPGMEKKDCFSCLLYCLTDQFQASIGSF